MPAWQEVMGACAKPIRSYFRFGKLIAESNLHLQCIIQNNRHPKGRMPASTLHCSFGTRPFQPAVVPPLGPVRSKYRSIIRCSRCVETETISRRANMQVGGIPWAACGPLKMINFPNLKDLNRTLDIDFCVDVSEHLIRLPP